MKIQYPTDAPFAVDVPDLDAEGIEPGTSIDVDDDTVATSLLAQGWVPVDKAAKDFAKQLEEQLGAAVDEPRTQEGATLAEGETGVLEQEGDLR